MEDFLVWYNNRDVAPFVDAVESTQKFYFEGGIDVFKNVISVPGVAREMLSDAAEEAGACLALFDQNNEDLYHTLRNNTIGGPSIIFRRHRRSRKTYIREEKINSAEG